MTRLPEPTDLRDPHQRDLSEREWRLGDFPISFWDETGDGEGNVLHNAAHQPPPKA